MTCIKQFPSIITRLYNKTQVGTFVIFRLCTKWVGRTANKINSSRLLNYKFLAVINGLQFTFNLQAKTIFFLFILNKELFKLFM